MTLGLAGRWPKYSQFSSQLSQVLPSVLQWKFICRWKKSNKRNMLENIYFFFLVGYWNLLFVSLPGESQRMGTNAVSLPSLESVGIEMLRCCWSIASHGFAAGIDQELLCSVERCQSERTVCVHVWFTCLSFMCLLWTKDGQLNSQYKTKLWKAIQEKEAHSLFTCTVRTKKSSWNTNMNLYLHCQISSWKTICFRHHGVLTICGFW